MLTCGTMVSIIRHPYWWRVWLYHMGLQRLRAALVKRMLQDLDGPIDNGRFGWELTVVSLLWLLNAKTEFNLNAASFEQLTKRTVNTAYRFGIPEERVIVGLYLLKSLNRGGKF